MKFCDEKIQECLLNGGKIKRTNQKFSYYLSESLKRFCYKYNNEIREYSISKEDLEADDWTIVEPEYDWKRIIKNKVLCVFNGINNHNDLYGIYPILGYLVKYNENENYKFTALMIDSCKADFKQCKPFNSKDYNIAKDLKEYEE